MKSVRISFKLNVLNNIVCVLIQIVNLFKKPDCNIIFDEVQGRHRHKLTDRDDHSERYPTFFNGEDITGQIELRLNSKTLKHKGIKAELHGILEKYGTINKTKTFLNLTSEVSRPDEITQEKIYLDFNFQNVKMPYESYKGDYATVKYFIKIIIITTVKNAEYEKEFAVVNPYDSSILQNNDEPIRMQVGMKQKLSLSIYFQHKNYNCRGTLKGFLFFNFLKIPLKFMEVQIVRREVIFGDKKCEPAYVARYELIDGVPSRNERIPIRFFLKSYNLTPTYQNVDNVFCVKYFLNLVIADEEDNRYFKQKEICLFRLYKERKNYYNGNNNYNNDEDYNYNNDEIFITEPIYAEDYSLDYVPDFRRKIHNQQGRNNDNNYNEYLDNFNGPILPNEEDDFGNNNINNYYNNDYRDNNNFNRNNRNNTFDDNNYNNNNLDNNNNSNYNKRNTFTKNSETINNRNNNRKNNSMKNDNFFINDDFNDNYNDNNDYNNNYNNINNNRNNNNIYNDNSNNRNNQNNYNQGRINNNKYNKRAQNEINEIINNNPSNYHSIKVNNSSNSYDDPFNVDADFDDLNNIINTNNRRNNNNNYSNDFNNVNKKDNMPPLDKKTGHSHRNNLMQARISNEEDFKNIFNTLDNNQNKEDLKKNIFG